MNYAILHIGRSGSTILEKALSAEGVRCDGEVLTHLEKQKGYKYARSSENLLRHLEQYLSHAGNSSTLCFELKLINALTIDQPPATTLSAIHSTLRKFDVGVITLRRQNSFARYCSSYKASKDQIYHLTNESDYKSKTAKISIDLGNITDWDTGIRSATLESFCRDVKAVEENFFRTFDDLTLMSLSYEDDIQNDYRVAVDKVLTLVEGRTSSTGEHKSPPIVRNPSARELISNIDEIDDFFASNPHFSNFRLC